MNLSLKVGSPATSDAKITKTRLRNGFELEVGSYFHNMSSYLNLHRLKNVYKPRDFDRVKWLVLRTLKSWDAERIVERFFPRIAADRTKSELDNKRFENKKKHVDNEIRKLENYDLPRRKLAI